MQNIISDALVRLKITASHLLVPWRNQNPVKELRGDLASRGAAALTGAGVAPSAVSCSMQKL